MILSGTRPCRVLGLGVTPLANSESDIIFFAIWSVSKSTSGVTGLQPGGILANAFSAPPTTFGKSSMGRYTVTGCPDLTLVNRSSNSPIGILSNLFIALGLILDFSKNCFSSCLSISGFSIFFNLDISPILLFKISSSGICPSLDRLINLVAGTTMALLTTKSSTQSSGSVSSSHTTSPT